MIDPQGIRLLVREIEQNLRTADGSIKTFVNHGGILERLQNERNQIIFGRRGSGKTLLLNNFLRNYPATFTFHAKVNLEQFKGDSLEDAICGTLISIFEQYRNHVDPAPKGYWDRTTAYLRKAISGGKSDLGTINATLQYLQGLLAEVENSEVVSEEKDSETNTSALKMGLKGTKFEIKEGGDQSKAIKKTYRLKKGDSLKANKRAIRSLLISLTKSWKLKKMYISLDDFYFIRKEYQPYFIDFFHNLTKGTNIILKVATIRQRSQLSIKTETFIGVDLTDDIQPIDLDFTLDRFDSLQSFMTQILNAFISSSYAESVKISDLIDPPAFRALCIASGGVPRDFLTYFIEVCEVCISRNSHASVQDVYDIASKYLNNKLQHFEQDSQDDKAVLWSTLAYIRREIITKQRTNVFLLSTSVNQRSEALDQVVKELVDMRLLHQLATNLRIDGRPDLCNAYLLDMAFYASNLREDFNYLDINAINILDRRKLDDAPVLESTENSEIAIILLM